MCYHPLVVDRVIKEHFRPRELLSPKLELMRLIRIGILKGREGYDFPMRTQPGQQGFCQQSP